MYSASDIGAIFVRKAIEEGNPITQMKLQKIIYFAQGHQLAVYDKPLFKEAFQAWKFGPVVPIIYDDYKLYGNMPIAIPDKARISVSTSFVSDKEVSDSIAYTWEATNDKTAGQLSAWTHNEDGPWSKVYNPNEWAIPIPNSLIKEYFTKLLFE